MATDTNKILEKIYQKEALTAKKLCELVELNGGGENPVGTQYTITTQQACDEFGGDFIPLLIVNTYEDGELTDTSYTTLDGDPYIIQGTLGLCPAGDAIFDTDPIVDAVEELTGLIEDSQRDCDDPEVKTLKVEVCNALPETAYNNNTQIVISGIGTETLLANTHHSISIAIVNGTGNITVGTGPTLTAPAGYTKQYSATTLLANEIVVTGTTGSLIVIDSIN